jgi:hypothetical protein
LAVLNAAERAVSIKLMREPSALFKSTEPETMRSATEALSVSSLIFELGAMVARLLSAK